MPRRRTNQAQPADAIAMLKADHQTVRDLFQQYEATRDPSAKREVAEQVFIELETHAQLKESLEAHETMKHLIQTLRSMGPDPHEFDAKFRALLQHVEHHVAEEEAVMFPLAEEELEEDMKDLRDEMQELKKELLAS
jgi:iron-sulfur cluster repair protein YtfE (RIC family)